MNIIPFILYLFNNSIKFNSSISYTSNFISYPFIFNAFMPIFDSFKLKYSLNIFVFPEYLSPINAYL